MKAPRLQDVAKAAGVSAATVTRVIRENGYVSSQKREQVLEAMQKLGYSHAPIVSEKYGVPLVAILTQFATSNWLFHCIAETICGEAQKNGWFGVDCYVNVERSDSIVDAIERLRKSNLKGIVFNGLGDSELLLGLRKYLTELSVPLVMIERSPEIYGINRVMINTKEAVFLAVKYLAHYGHRKILFLSRDVPQEVERARKDGFHAGAAAMGIERDAIFVHIPQHDEESGYYAIKEYISKNGLPTAVIGGDHVIVGVCKYLYELDVRVPQQVSLMGLDDSVASLLSPPLSSISFPLKEIAENTIQIIQDAQNGDALPKTVYLSTRLVERDTIAPPANERHTTDGK